jgi:hypothetical protein
MVAMHARTCAKHGRGLVVSTGIGMRISCLIPYREEKLRTCILLRMYDPKKIYDCRADDAGQANKVFKVREARSDQRAMNRSIVHSTANHSIPGLGCVKKYHCIISTSTGVACIARTTTTTGVLGRTHGTLAFVAVSHWVAGRRGLDAARAH